MNVYEFCSQLCMCMVFLILGIIILTDLNGISFGILVGIQWAFIFLQIGFGYAGAQE